MEQQNVEQRNIKAGGDVSARDIIKDNTYIDYSQTVNFYEAAKLLPSNLAAIINVLGKHLVFQSDISRVVFSPDEKISHNNVKRHSHVIEYYYPLTGKLIIAYDECDAQGTNITAKALSSIKLTYLQIRGEYLSKHEDKPLLEVVRIFADEIFTKVEQSLYGIVKESSNIDESVEVIRLSIQVIMIDAFVKCQILEEPPKNVIA